MGLSWSNSEPLAPEKTSLAPAGPGLYVLIDPGSQEVIYIGQSGNCADRLLDHSRKSWDGKELAFSFHGVEKPVLPHHSRNGKTISSGISLSYTGKRRNTSSGTRGSFGKGWSSEGFFSGHSPGLIAPSPRGL